MSQKKVRFLGLIVAAGILTLQACHKRAPNTTATSNHVRAVGVAAQGTALLLKQPERSIEYYKQAVQLEYDSREWKSELAFAYFKAKRTPEAVPIWQELAQGKDDYASQAKRFLVKAGVNQ